MRYLEVINPSLVVSGLLENVNRRFENGIPFIELIRACEKTMGYFPFKAVDNMNGVYAEGVVTVYFPIIDRKVIID